MAAYSLSRRFALVFVGGSAGGAARITLDEVVTGDGSIPLTLLAINLCGSVLIAVIAVRLGGHRTWWPLLGPGFLGGFTTFSAIAALNWTSNAGGGASIAVLAATLVACAAAAVIGLKVAATSRLDNA